jgi:hypothetical protein
MFNLTAIKEALKGEIVELPFDAIQSFDHFKLFLKQYTDAQETIMKKQENVKFQYIKTPDQKLCITVGTEIIDSDKFSHVFFAVSFKHPKDRFNRRIAREQVMDNFPKMDFVSGELILDKGNYTRFEIVEKIMMHLHINNVYMTKDYQRFVADIVWTGVW